MSKKPSNPTGKGTGATTPDLFNTPATTITDLEEMTKYGIKCVPVDYFHFGDFRYTNLADAIAQAKRGCSGLSSVKALDNR